MTHTCANDRVRLVTLRPYVSMRPEGLWTTSTAVIRELGANLSIATVMGWVQTAAIAAGRWREAGVNGVLRSLRAAGWEGWLRVCEHGLRGSNLRAAWVMSSVAGWLCISARVYRRLVRAGRALSVLPARVEQGVTTMILSWHEVDGRFRHVRALEVWYEALHDSEAAAAAPHRPHGPGLFSRKASFPRWIAGSSSSFVSRGGDSSWLWNLITNSGSGGVAALGGSPAKSARDVISQRSGNDGRVRDQAWRRDRPAGGAAWRSWATGCVTAELAGEMGGEMRCEGGGGR